MLSDSSCNTQRLTDPLALVGLIQPAAHLWLISFLARAEALQHEVSQGTSKICSFGIQSKRFLPRRWYRRWGNRHVFLDQLNVGSKLKCTQEQSVCIREDTLHFSSDQTCNIGPQSAAADIQA